MHYNTGKSVFHACMVRIVKKTFQAKVPIKYILMSISCTFLAFILKAWWILLLSRSDVYRCSVTDKFCVPTTNATYWRFQVSGLLPKFGRRASVDKHTICHGTHNLHARLPRVTENPTESHTRKRLPCWCCHLWIQCDITHWHSGVGGATVRRF